MAEKISCFKMKSFWALNTFAIYFNISKIRVLIQITIRRNAGIQMVLSKNNRFTAEEAKNCTPRTEKRKKGTSMWNAWVLWVFPSSMLPILSWKLKIIACRSSSTIAPSSKLELLCQWEMTSMVTKSFIIDDLGARDLPLVCLFSV